MVGSFKIADNVISGGQSTGISLSGCGGGTVFDNSIVHNNGAAVSVDGGSGIDIAQNYLDDTLAPNSPVSVTNSTSVTQEANTTPAMIPVGRTISLKAAANGMYVCADNYGNSPLIANRSAVGQWEQYTVVDAGNGNVGLLAHANNEVRQRRQRGRLAADRRPDAPPPMGDVPVDRAGQQRRYRAEGHGPTGSTSART